MSYGGRRNHDPWNDSYRRHYGGGYGGGKSHGNSYGGSGSNDARDYYYNDRGDNYAVPKQERSEYSDPGSSSYYQPQRREYHSGSGARRTWSPSRPNSRSPDFGSSDYGGGAGASSGFARRSSPTYSSPPHRPWGAGGAARRARKEHFVPHLPPAAYIELSREEPTTTPEPSPKLLVLDLNGALLYRSENKSAAGRVSYPRPFLHNFLAYLMTPEPSGEASPYEVLVWSSAQPQNVRVMVETTFGPWCDGQWGEKPKLEHNEKRLLDVWARDKMNLGGDYHHNVQTTKDLRGVIGKIGRYDERSVLLLDDSPFKATEQPWSQIVVPEYDKPEYQSAMAAARTADLNKEDVSLKKGMDTALLAAVGILEAMAHQVNVPAWVRRGGINAPTGPEVDTSADVTLDSLPSASTFEHWFNNTKTRGYWVEAGKAALKRKHIELAHGISYPANDPKDSAKTKPVISRHSANVTRQSLTDLSENENTTAEQRAVLLRALDVMADLGFGPSTRSKPTETVPETHTTQAREDPDPTPVANASSTETTVAKPKAKSKKIQPPTKAQVKEARAAAADRSRNIQLVERAHRSGEFDPANVSFSLPIASRPAKPVLKFLRALTMDSYHTLKEQVETLKTRLDRAAANANANMSEQQHEGRRARLADLLERLDLIVVLPDSPEYPSMVYMYGILPQHEEPPTHPQDVGRNRKRQRQE